MQAIKNIQTETVSRSEASWRNHLNNAHVAIAVAVASCVLVFCSLFHLCNYFCRFFFQNCLLKLLFLWFRIYYDGRGFIKVGYTIIVNLESLANSTIRLEDFIIHYI